jgi:polygalacturonase
LGHALLIASFGSARADEKPLLFNPRAFGAVGDSKTVDTAAFNKAIEAAHAAGGGTVFVSAGTYVCGSIHLQSNIAIHVDQGATIVASADPADYDQPEPNKWDKFQDFGHSHWHNSFFWGEDIENVTIDGSGLLYGKGLSKMQGSVQPHLVGNKTISLKNCHNITLRDISILHGGHFAILVTGVDNLTIDNLKIDTNRDGMDIDCCRNVRVSNCSVNSPWDDAICPKSSFGLGVLRPTENVSITNCYVSGGWQEGTLLDGTFKPFEAQQRIPRTGRIKFGTESNGGFKNMAISNCIFENCGGLAIESVDGAIIEDVSITNITMRGIVNSPIFIRLGNRARGPDNPPPGVIRRVNISNVVCSNAASRLGSIISGIPGHPIEDLRISNVQIVQQGGGTAANAEIKPPERENTYPEPGMFGTMPSYGFYIRHVKNLEMHHIDVSYDKPDMRPVMALNDVAGVEMDHIKAKRTPSVPFFVLHDVTDFSVQNATGIADTKRENASDESF